MPDITFNRTTTLSFPGSNIPDITNGIVNGSLAVREILCADRIVFGDINANQFQCQLYDCPNLLKKKIQVKQSDNGVTKVVFTGWVTSCKTDDLTGFKIIEAYDYFYKARTKKIKKWWKTYWSDRTESTIGAMWKNMLSYYSIPYTNTTLMFDSKTIKKKQAKKLKTVYMTGFLNQLCEINMCIPNFNREGTLEFIKFSGLSTSNAIDIRDYYTISSSKFEEEVHEPFDKVELFNEKNNGGESAGEGDNALSIENNVFLYGLGTDDLAAMADMILTNMYTLQYVTGDITMKVSNLDIKLGDVVRVADKGGSARYCLVCENNYKGSLLVDQSITSNYEDAPNIEHGVYGNTIARNDNRLEYNLDMKPDNNFGMTTPSDDLGKVGDTYFKTGTQITRMPVCEVEFNGKYSDMANPYYTKPQEYLTIKIVDWQDGGYRILYSGPLQAVDDPRGPGYMYFGWHSGNPVFEVKIPETGWYRWHCYAKYSVEGDYMDGEALEILVGDGDPAAGYGVIVPEGPGNPPGTVLSSGTGFNVHLAQGVVHGEYSGTFQIKDTSSWYQNGRLYFFIYPHRAFPNDYRHVITHLELELTGFYFEKYDPETGQGDGGYTETSESYIDGIYTKPSSTETDAGESSWQEVDYVHKVDNSEDSGLSYSRPNETAQKVLSLKPNVMRAWFKADPPQVKRKFNQYCVRYTGKPDGNIKITLQSNTGWLNKSIKQDSEGVFTIKSGGSVTSGAIEYCAYKITGLTNGKKYYFNLKVNFKDGTTFGNNYGKGLGLVFNTTGVIATDDWTGDPGTFNEDTLYYSMRRTTKGNFADFDFTATASTMYMCIVVADISGSQTSSLTLSRFVISQVERAYVRNFYIFDTVANDWLPYKPWGSGADDGGDGDASTLGDLDDVTLDNLSNGQTLYYNSETGQWVNGDSYELPIASADTLGGVKVGDNLSIDENGILSATDTNTDELSELTDVDIDDQTLADGQVLKYDGASQKWKNGTGGSGGASSMSDLTDVDIDDQTLDAGQVLKWDSVNEKWVNEDEAGGTVSIELTKAEYDALPSADKNDPTKVYYVKNYQPVPQGSNMSDLEDVLIDDQTLDEGQVLKWDSVNEQWVNEDESGGASNIADLDDVDFGTLTNGDVLQYNSTTQKWENNTPTFTLPVASASTLGGIKIGDLFKMTANNALDMEFGRFLFTASGVATIASSDTYSKQIITVSKLMYRRISQYVTQTISYSNCILAIESVSLHNMSASGILYGDEEYARTKISVSEIADNGNSYDITILISNDMGLYISDFEIWVTGTYIGNPVIT